MGANTGYYGLLSLAAGAVHATLIEPDRMVGSFVHRVCQAHGLGGAVSVVAVSAESAGGVLSGSHFDVAFVFSLLHQLPEQAAVSVLKNILQCSRTVFLESGDDHELLQVIIRKAGITEPRLLGTLPVNHGLNMRQVWEAHR